MSHKITPGHLRELISTFVADHKAKSDVRDWWRNPLLVTARADDRFNTLPEIAADDHLVPSDLLPDSETVIVFFLPFKASLGKENATGKFPCRNWGLAYEDTNRLIGLIAQKISDYLTDHGFKTALTPATHNFDPEKLMARWSHKHLAYVSGLGRFGINAQMITPAGCAGRLGSLVTNAVIDDSPVVTEEELCIHKKGEECLKCVSRCPVKAVGENGINRQRCWDRLNFNLKHVQALAGMKNSTNVCGKCVVNLPCSIKTG
jgi:epoxyqueuosine reductase QueG